MLEIYLDLTGCITQLIKYIHSNCLLRKLRKTKFEHDKETLIMQLNHFVSQEKQILNTLIDNGNNPIESELTTYVNRLIQSRMLYEIPNSKQSLYDRNLEQEKERCEKDGMTLVSMWQSPITAPSLFALTLDAYNVLKYLKENKCIFQEFETKK